jgi:uncharacterized phage-associated protein
MSQLKRIVFPFDWEKSAHAVLWLLARHGGKLEVMKLVKLIYFADVSHLAKYGRPITGGVYMAMKYGPVSSSLYEKVKPKAENAFFKRVGTDIIAKGQYDEDFLSESDLEVLEAVNRKYGNKDQFVLSNETHCSKAWKKNYDHRGSKKTHPIPYEDLLLENKVKKEAFALIRENSEALAAFR